MAAVVREIERKYDASPAGTAALDAVESMIGVPGVAAVSQQDPEILDAVYYDTGDLRLVRAGVTLRRRTGGDDAGWHLKLPVGADTRDEIRIPLAAPAGKPAAGAASGRAGTPAVTLADQARAAGEDTFTYGVMHERQACQAAEIERTLSQVAIRAK